MKTDYSRILSEILITLKNLNDKARKCEDELFDISSKLTKMEQEKQTVTKHIVVLQKENKKPKEQK